MEQKTIREKIRALADKKTYTLADLRTLTEILRSPEGCPWDREQTHQSIRNDLIEECYEVVEAIDNADQVLLREELGDVLFQVYFHARIEEEAGRFSIDEVAGDICAKMIYRHPHVFGNTVAENSEKVLENWEKLKKAEKHRDTVRASMDAVPHMLPALMRAQKIAGKAIKDEYDFGTDDEIRVQMENAVRAVFDPDKEPAEKETALAKLSFFAALQSKKLGGDLEGALQKETTEFIYTYKNTHHMEENHE